MFYYSHRYINNVWLNVKPLYPPPKKKNLTEIAGSNMSLDSISIEVYPLIYAKHAALHFARPKIWVQSIFITKHLCLLA